MDELAIAMKAREFIMACGPPALPVSVDAYAAQIGGVVKSETLQENEDAWSFHDKNGKYRICVNCAHNPRRQRFSVCHEVAHVVLEISSDHSNPSWSYSRRPPGEIACDVFAAELLLPYKLFKPRVDAADMGLASISALADEFEASLIPPVRASPPFLVSCAHSSSPKAARFATVPARPIFATPRLGLGQVHHCRWTPTARVYAPEKGHRAPKKQNRNNGSKTGSAMDRSTKTPGIWDNGTRL